ncbi:MAG: Ribonucleoside-diphosphate reductase, partial [Parcubacteria group bacterium GW2011_GWA1_45_7]
IFVHTDRKPRNAALTTIAPTGTISVISDCSSGIEPIFALAYIRKARLNRGARDDKDEWVDLLEVNKTFEEIAKREGFYSEELMKKVALRGSVQGITEIPEHWRAVFKIAHDLKSEDHIRMQATFQKFVDNAVSKTVNFSNTASLEDVKKAYLLAWESGCKGITIYRDGSKEFQVLNLGFSQEPITVTTEEEDHRGENNIDETVSEAAVSIAYDQVPNTVIMAKDSGVCHNCD